MKHPTKQQIKQYLSQGYIIIVPEFNHNIKLNDTMNWNWFQAHDFDHQFYNDVYRYNRLVVSDEHITVPISFKYLWEDIHDILHSIIILDNNNKVIYVNN